MEEEIKLQEETITITEPVMDQDTGEYADETQVEIKQEVTAPEPIITTLGELKIALQDMIKAKQDHDMSYIDSSNYFNEQIAKLEAQISQIK